MAEKSRKKGKNFQLFPQPLLAFTIIRAWRALKRDSNQKFSPRLFSSSPAAKGADSFHGHRNCRYTRSGRRTTSFHEIEPLPLRVDFVFSPQGSLTRPGSMDLCSFRWERGEQTLLCRLCNISLCTAIWVWSVQTLSLFNLLRPNSRKEKKNFLTWKLGWIKRTGNFDFATSGPEKETFMRG